jgi:nucleotide-binding universal stress UspA family protein
MSTPVAAVVVAVGADGSPAAIDYGVAEARRRSLPLHLVHVLQLPTADAHSGVYVDMSEAGAATLARASDRAGASAGSDVEVSSELVVAGWVADQVARRGDEASLLVLEHRALGRVRRALGGSVVQSVAGRAPGPVISVPAGHDPASETHGVVTVAVQHAAEAEHLLPAALAEAHRRGAALVVLHAWWLGSGHDDGVVDDTYRQEMRSQTRRELEPVVDRLRRTCPDVGVGISVVHAPPAEAVREATTSSDLLVIGRRHHRLPIGSHLGHVARSALAHSSCPVLVTPEPTGPPAEP